MIQRSLSGVTVIVPSYAEGLACFRDKMGFSVLEDVDLGGGKRWLVVAPANSSQARLILAQPGNDQQRQAMGQQVGDRVGFFLQTDDFDRDFADFIRSGIEFQEAPRTEPYGKVAVFRDDFGNLWDLIQPAV
jgi:catechol 2,3-dioxygenase-like lactoylglutathione lyase family enzyme